MIALLIVLMSLVVGAITYRMRGGGHKWLRGIPPFRTLRRPLCALVVGAPLIYFFSQHIPLPIDLTFQPLLETILIGGLIVVAIVLSSLTVGLGHGVYLDYYWDKNPGENPENAIVGKYPEEPDFVWYATIWNWLNRGNGAEIFGNRWLYKFSAMCVTGLVFVAPIVVAMLGLSWYYQAIDTNISNHLLNCGLITAAGGLSKGIWYVGKRAIGDRFKIDGVVYSETMFGVSYGLAAGICIILLM